MEDRAPYHTAAPAGPRNLAAPLTAWLRTQGFTATEYQTLATFASVAAHWVGSRGECFQFYYCWLVGPVAAEATCQLQVRYPGQALVEPLFGAQRVHRLRDAKVLLLGNLRYANARLLATLPHHS